MTEARRTGIATVTETEIATEDQEAGGLSGLASRASSAPTESTISIIKICD
jgi:hypothetical protein